MTIFKLEKQRQRQIAEELVERIKNLRAGRIPVVKSGEESGFFWTGIKLTPPKSTPSPQ